MAPIVLGPSTKSDCALQAVALLADHVEDYASIAPKGQQDHIWFTATDLARTAAAAGAFLMDILQMKDIAFNAGHKERRHRTAESNQGML